MNELSEKGLIALCDYCKKMMYRIDTGKIEIYDKKQKEELYEGLQTLLNKAEKDLKEKSIKKKDK